MRKKLITLVAVIAILALAVMPTSLVPVFAGSYKENGLNDNFDGASLDATKWNAVNNGGGEISQFVMPGTLKMISMPAGSGIVTQEKVGADDKGLVIEFDLLDYGNAGLIRILKGMAAQTPSQEDLDDSYLQNAGDVRSTRGDWKPFANYNHSSGWLAANAWGSIGFSKLGSTYQFVFNADGSFFLNTKDIGADDSTYTAQIKTEATDVENQWANAKFSKTGSGYVGFYFESANGSLVIDNINIYSQDKVSTFSDNFEYFNLDTAKWKASDEVVAGFGKSLRLNNIGDDQLGKSTTAQLVSKTKLVDLSTKDKIAVELSMNVKINELHSGSAGVVFGLDDENGFLPSTNRFAIMLKAKDGKINLGALKNGVVFGTDIEIGNISIFADYISLKFVVTNNGSNQTITVYVNDIVKTYAFQKLDGHIAFTQIVDTYTHIITPAIPAVEDDPETTDIDESKPAVPAVTENRKGLIDVEFDDFKVVYTKYAVAEGKDLVQKFDNADLGEEWYLRSIGLGGAGSEDKPEKPLPEGWGVNVVDGKLVFNNASDGSYFGPSKKYGNFDLSFDVSDIGYETIMDEDDNYVMMKSAFFGITFGRENLDTQYHGGNGFANTLFFDHNPWGGTDGTADGAELGRLYLTQGNTGNITDLVYNYANPWTEANQKRGPLTVRVTVTDGLLNVYVRYADEPASKLDQPILTAQVESKIGYVALTCTEPTYYSIDNFSIKNIDQTGVIKDSVKPCPNPDDHNNVCPKPSDHDKQEPTNKGCGSTTASLGAIAALVLSAGALVVLKKR